MTDENLEIKQKLKDDFEHYASKCLRIRYKHGNGTESIDQFNFNRAQKYVHSKIEEQRKKTGKVRVLILKGRQQGISTYVGGRFFHQVTHRYGCQAFILTHALDATQNLFKMAQRFYEHCPRIVTPRVSTSNRKELVFGNLDSGYKVGTAENKSVGRSSTIQLFHGSEVAFWNNAEEHAKGILQAVPDAPGTEIILESTANGLGNYFHQMWQKAEAGVSDFLPIFVPWYWQDEYKRLVDSNFEPYPNEFDLMQQYKISKEQIAWRRHKIIDVSVSGQDGDKSFQQEYPFNSAEAFVFSGDDTFIRSELVIAARKCRAEKYGKVVIGVDPAGFGNDRTAIIRRQGRVAYGLETYKKKTPMEVVGIISRIIETEHPYKVFIDVGGLGVGIVDRLHELGYREIVIPVNFGSTPLDVNKYKNKRAEMWGLLREWLTNIPCEIPDLDSLHADLVAANEFKNNSNGQLIVLEPKESMKKKGLRSPDEGDALALTFSYPESALTDENNSRDKKIAANIMSKQLHSKKLRQSQYGNYR